MAEKFAIYFGEPLATATVGYEQSRSARVNQIAQDWLQLIAQGMPVFSAAEWQALAASMASTELGDDVTLKMLWAAVADSQAACAPHGVNAEALAAKVRALPLVGRYAMREGLARLWSAVEAGEDMQAAVRRLGTDTSGS